MKGPADDVAATTRRAPATPSAEIGITETIRPVPVGGAYATTTIEPPTAPEVIAVAVGSMDRAFGQRDDVLGGDLTARTVIDDDETEDATVPLRGEDAESARERRRAEHERVVVLDLPSRSHLPRRVDDGHRSARDGRARGLVPPHRRTSAGERGDARGADRRRDVTTEPSLRGAEPAATADRADEHPASRSGEERAAVVERDELRVDDAGERHASRETERRARGERRGLRSARVLGDGGVGRLARVHFACAVAEDGARSAAYGARRLVVRRAARERENGGSEERGREAEEGHGWLR